MKKKLIIELLGLVLIWGHFGCKKDSINETETNDQQFNNKNKASISHNTRITNLTSNGGYGQYKVIWEGTQLFFTGVSNSTTFQEGEVFSATVTDINGNLYSTSGSYHAISVQVTLTNQMPGGTVNFSKYRAAWSEMLQKNSDSDSYNNVSIPILADFVDPAPTSTVKYVKAVLIRTKNSPTTYAIASANYPVVPPGYLVAPDIQ